MNTMKLLKKLIRLHRFLFFSAMLLTLSSVFLNLYWSGFLADVMDVLGSASRADSRGSQTLPVQWLATAAVIILFNIAAECLSSCLASCTCEAFAHEMRMGHAGYYLQGDVRTLSGRNVGEEQSAMQNELAEVSAYFRENLFPFVKQFVSFAVTVAFLLCRNARLTLLYVLPVAPLVVYCYRSGKVIKHLTEQCQTSRKRVNGLTATLLELFPVIRVYGAHRLMDAAMDEALLQWKSSNIRKERIAAGLMSLSGVLSFVPLLFLLGFGGSMAVNGEISVGSFYIFINLSGNVSGFLQNMPGAYAAFRRFQASAGRLEKRLALRGE